jgi:hypothetical protein
MHDCPGVRDEVRPRGIDDEALAERGQPRDEVEGVVTESGRTLTHDGGIDRDRALDGHGYKYNPSRTPVQP